jgi:large subunit ribosomal protein L15
MLERGLVKKGKNIKILSDGNLTKKVEIHAQCFSACAREKIEKAGGKAVVAEKAK